MKRYGAWIIIGLMTFLSACSPLRNLPPQHAADFCETEARQAAAVRNRWIGLMKNAGGGCPVPTLASGWTVRPLFPIAGLEKSLRRSARRAGLDRFCVYEYRYGGRVPRLELPREIARRLLSVEPDRVAMAGAAGLLEEAVWRPFVERFSAQVPTPEPVPLGPAGLQRVRLAVIDTQGSANFIPSTSGPSGHGYALAHIAGHLSRWQGSGSAAVEVVTQLALPIVSFEGGIETRSNDGGFRGSFQDLALAIVTQVNDWKAQQTGPGPHRLVINLSVGWDGEKFGGLGDGEMPPTVQAVYSALEMAADEGVLVLAAAGNARPGRQSTDLPFLPAAWEVHTPATQRVSERPLVYAVSGVDHRNLPLVNTRPLGEASRVAYADHVVVPDFYRDSLPTAVLTGTSVATTVAATTAALVWSYRPDLSPEEVMGILSTSGQGLGRAPSSFFGGSAPVRRISLCEALVAACNQPGSACPALACPSRPEPGPIKLFPQLTMNGSQLPPGDPDMTLRNVLDDPFVNPQPGMDPCPPCNLTLDAELGLTASFGQRTPGIVKASTSSAGSNLQPSAALYKLQVEISDRWSGFTLEEPTLEVFAVNPSGNKLIRKGFSLTPWSSTALAPGQWLTVSNLDLSALGGTPVQAILSFKLTKGSKTMLIQSPLFVEP